MRAFATIVVGLAFASSALAQETGGIDGSILDAQARPVVGAIVELTPGSRRIVSDGDGGFSFRSLAAGSYTVHVRRIGYRPATRAVDVLQSGVNVTITLAAIPQILDSIRVRERSSNLRYAATVLDDVGRPIPDVAVMVAGIENAGRTDAAGHFVVSKGVHGTVMLRMRKIGYRAFFGSFTVLADREDTLRMPRLPQGLSAVQITEQSGFGRDTFAYKDLDQRMRWRTHAAHAASREELDRLGHSPLCPGCGDVRRPCVILNGGRGPSVPAASLYADEVEALEVYPPKSDWSGNLASRGCGRGLTWVVWLRKDVGQSP